MGYPDKDIPTEYTQQATTTLYANQPALATDWHDLVDNQNYVFAHKGTKFAGHVWNPPWDGTSSIYFGVNGSDDPEREDEHINLCGIPQKPIKSVGYILEIFVFGEDYQLDFDIVNLDVDPTTNIASPKISHGDGLDWETSEVSLSFSDVTTDGTVSGPPGMLRIRFTRSDGPGDNGTSLHEVYIEEKVIVDSNASTRLVSVRGSGKSGPYLSILDSNDISTLYVEGALWDSFGQHATNEKEAQDVVVDSNNEARWFNGKDYFVYDTSLSLQSFDTAAIGGVPDRSSASIALDSNEDSWVLVSRENDSGNQKVFETNRTSGTWSSDTNIQELDDETGYSLIQLHIDENDVKHITYHETKKGIDATDRFVRVNYLKTQEGSVDTWNSSSEEIDITRNLGANAGSPVVQSGLTTGKSGGSTDKTDTTYIAYETQDSGEPDTAEEGLQLAIVDHSSWSPTVSEIENVDDKDDEGLATAKVGEGMVDVFYKEDSDNGDRLYYIAVSDGGVEIWKRDVGAGSDAWTEVANPAQSWTATNNEHSNYGKIEVNLQADTVHVYHAQGDGNGDDVPGYATGNLDGTDWSNEQVSSDTVYGDISGAFF